MPNELTISAVAAASGESETPAEPQAQPATPPSHAPPPPAAPMPNPQLRFDPELALVVIEFRDSSGAITLSVPSQRQLNAYRMWQQNGGVSVGADSAAQAGNQPPGTSFVTAADK